MLSLSHHFSLYIRCLPFSLSIRLFISFIFIATSWPVSHLKRDVCTFRCFCWIIFRHTSKCTCHRFSSSEQTMRFYRIILLQIIWLWSCFTIDLLSPRPVLNVCAFIFQLCFLPCLGFHIFMQIEFITIFFFLGWIFKSVKKLNPSKYSYANEPKAHTHTNPWIKWHQETASAAQSFTLDAESTWNTPLAYKPFESNDKFRFNNYLLLVNYILMPLEN